jgi:hypothetical protein
MGFINTIFAAATGISGLFAGQTAAKDMKKVFKIVKVVLICITVLAVMFSLCLLSIGVYTTILIVKEVMS